MSTNRARLLGAVASAFLITVAVGTQSAATDSGVVPVTDYGGGCVIDPGDFSVTLDSLRSRCAFDQQNAIFSDASAGRAPSGVRNGWVLSPVAIQPISAAMWTGKTFYLGSAITDGAPTWVLNYDPSPIPQIYDEIREIAPVCGSATPGDAIPPRRHCC